MTTHKDKTGLRHTIEFAKRCDAEFKRKAHAIATDDTIMFKTRARKIMQLGLESDNANTQRYMAMAVTDAQSAGRRLPRRMVQTAQDILNPAAALERERYDKSTDASFKASVDELLEE